MKIPYGKHSISEEDIKAVCDVLRSDFLTQGPKIEEFEKQFASVVGAKYAVAVCNGTAALHLGALALNIKSGDEVITTPISFVATANCVRYCGGDVYFCDVDANIILNVEEVHKTLKKYPQRFKGLIVVDFAGMPANTEKFREIADEYNLWIIEDSCHAPGGFFVDSQNNKQLVGNGNYSDLSIFSFHPVKHLACGEGGMITTNNEQLYNKLKKLRTHGITKDIPGCQEGWYYEMQQLGFNYRMPDMNAALGVSQLKNLHTNIAARHAIAKKYDTAFANTLIKPVHPYSEGHAYHLYTVKVPNRLGLYNFLRSQGIFAQIHYIPIPQQPYYRSIQKQVFDIPVAQDYYDHCLSLPIFPSLKETEQDYVIEKIQQFYFGK